MMLVTRKQSGVKRTMPAIRKKKKKHSRERISTMLVTKNTESGKGDNVDG